MTGLIEPIADPYELLRILMMPVDLPKKTAPIYRSHKKIKSRRSGYGSGGRNQCLIKSLGRRAFDYDAIIVCHPRCAVHASSLGFDDPPPDKRPASGMPAAKRFQPDTEATYTKSCGRRLG